MTSDSIRSLPLRKGREALALEHEALKRETV
jgi:hypothetical protein